MSKLCFNTMLKRGCAVLLSGVVGLQLGLAPASPGSQGSWVHMPVAQAQSEDNGPKLEWTNERYITAGARLKEVVWRSTRGNNDVAATARVIEVDLLHPYVELDVMTGQGGKLATRNSVRGMSHDHGAVAGVNGDYYDLNAEGAPIGPQVTSGRLLSSPSRLEGMYAFGLTEDRKPVIDRFEFEGTVVAPNGEAYPLAGINKTYYYTEPDGMHSHVDTIYLYTPEWGSLNRANDGSTTPTELLVQDGIVTDISIGEPLAQTPPPNGYILRASRKAARFLEEHFRTGDPIEISYALTPVDAKEQYDADRLQMLIGGHTLLVDEGKPVDYTRNVSSLGGYRARTGIGYSQDGRYVYLITVDRSGDSLGMSLGEFRDFMVRIGVWKGLNLDGGGSTQMVARPLGDFQIALANQPEGASERRVVNGLGVFTTAPQGKLKEMIPGGMRVLFLGETAQYDLKAYDEYYNPLDVSDLAVEWSVTHDAGTFDGNILTAQRTGTAEVVAVADGVKSTKEIEVVGREHIDSMYFLSGEAILEEGKDYDLTVELVTRSGFKRTVPADRLQWDVYGLQGTIRDGRLYVDRVTSSDGAGYVVARYDGYGTMRALAPRGVEQPFTEFVDAPPSVSFSGYPEGVTGDVSWTAGLPGKDPGVSSLFLRYDFEQGTGTRAAYAHLNDGEGIVVPGEPTGMIVDVYGDESGNWVRAEFMDLDGGKHLVDLTRNMDWSGWKSVEADLSSYDIKFPAKLTRLYVANPEQGQADRLMTGEVAFADIHLVYTGFPPQTDSTEVTLTVGESVMRVDGTEASLDQPPVIVNGSTLVPLRFVTDALGGQIGWDNETKRVTVLGREQLIDMWIGDTEVTVNGSRMEAPVQPDIMNGRTMVPLRLLSELFGWQVGWDNDTKTVKLQG